MHDDFLTKEWADSHHRIGDYVDKVCTALGRAVAAARVRRQGLVRSDPAHPGDPTGQDGPQHRPWLDPRAGRPGTICP